MENGLVTVPFFQECFKVSFLWAYVHGTSLGLVI